MVSGIASFAVSRDGRPGLLRLQVVCMRNRAVAQEGAGYEARFEHERVNGLERAVAGYP